MNIDPCMGSGHILVYAFEVLMQIYESEGYNARDAAELILEKNLYGLDIDHRAYQLAYFSLIMKARQYNRHILTRGLKTQVYHPAGFPDGEEYGSLVKVDKLPPIPEEPKEITLFTENYETVLNTWNFKRLLSQKYDVVVTNPPYMGGSGMSATLSDYVKNNYPDSKSDLFAVFIEKCGELLNSKGYQAMITQHAWMFLSSYEKLRDKLMHRDIVNMVHLGARAFEEIGGEVVQTTTFVLSKRNIANFEATYVRLVEYNSQKVKEEAFLTGNDRHTAKKENFQKIPGYPVTYWVSEAMLKAFEMGNSIESYSTPRQGMGTGDNNQFLRIWWEVAQCKIGYGFETLEAADLSNLKWFPYNKGGEYRKWYGNNEYVVNFQNDGREVKASVMKKYPYLKTPDFVIKNTSSFFKECITWSQVSSGSIAFRYKPVGFISGGGAASIFHSQETLYYLQGACNSKVMHTIAKLLSPTLNFEINQVKDYPVIEDKNKKIMVNKLVKANISLSCEDWDSFETSWDFKKHPLI